jgi:hypothetical protein
MLETIAAGAWTARPGRPSNRALRLLGRPRLRRDAREGPPGAPPPSPIRQCDASPQVPVNGKDTVRHRFTPIPVTLHIRIRRIRPKNARSESRWRLGHSYVRRTGPR